MKTVSLKMQWSSALKQQDLLREAVAKYIDHFFPNQPASGTSAVAIDNKIEQAMDLVKSHLMFAVREEVEVLKEKIVELTGRINQLEFENTVLKAHASADTLQLISKPPPTQNSKLHTHTYTRTHPYERLTHTHTLGRACLVCENELRSSLPRPTPRRVLSAPEIYS
ncbi:Hypothetical predicted protein [Cloeon dipterum]|uniref:Uncharacterized protein n=1 Tax=Cloeon dipterum TaxID=197152 RepID=A0A8S1DDZ2_9INSE|nr:Hypothetical predicted protein [Cloeon dipterum]